MMDLNFINTSKKRRSPKTEPITKQNTQNMNKPGGIPAKKKRRPSTPTSMDKRSKKRFFELRIRPRHMPTNKSLVIPPSFKNMEPGKCKNILFLGLSFLLTLLFLGLTVCFLWSWQVFFSSLRAGEKTKGQPFFCWLITESPNFFQN